MDITFLEIANVCGNDKHCNKILKIFCVLALHDFGSITSINLRYTWYLRTNTLFQSVKNGWNIGMNTKVHYSYKHFQHVMSAIIHTLMCYSWSGAVYYFANFI